MQRVYYLSPNQIQRKKKLCKAILLNKGEMTFQLGLQIDKYSVVSILRKNILHKNTLKCISLQKNAFNHDRGDFIQIKGRGS